MAKNRDMDGVQRISDEKGRPSHDKERMGGMEENGRHVQELLGGEKIPPKNGANKNTEGSLQADGLEHCRPLDLRAGSIGMFFTRAI